MKKTAKSIWVGAGRAIGTNRQTRLNCCCRPKNGNGYRNAWLEVEEMNRLAPKPLVIKMLGGAGGGQAILTAEGQKIINEYKELRARFWNF